MATTKVNIKKLVDNIRRTNIYQPIIEAIVNAIDSIDEAKKGSGEIRVVLNRDSQASLLDDSRELSPFTSIEIHDNGIGFTDKNLDSFNTIYSEEKVRRGGKGFGRFFFLKYFTDVTVDSTYSEQGVFYTRSFRFVKDADIIKDEKKEPSKSHDRHTVVSMNGLRREQASNLDKKIDTVARKLLEKLLVHFVLDDYECPKIIVCESGGKSIVLNDLIGDGKEISQIKAGKFSLENQDKKEDFKIKIFKILFGESRSAICLTADRRQVTDAALHDYVTDFRGDFYETVQNADSTTITKNFTVRAYVMGEYLDKHVADERDGFEFQFTKDLFFDFSQRDIEQKAAEVVKATFGEEAARRRDKKQADVKSYVDEKAPWHKSYIDELDLEGIPYGASEFEIESALQNLKFAKEQSTRIQIDDVLSREDATEISEKVEALVSTIDEIGKSELIHYVALRKIILDVLKKSLEWNDDKKYEKEKVIHDIVFPTKTDSDTLAYDRHNLWLLDERLSFTEYVASDQPLADGTRPDILIFDKKILVRGDNTASNPIVVFEFKRPQRDAYTEEDNPLKQIANYITKVRRKEIRTPEGRNIEVNGTTPAFGYLVCDLNADIESFCVDFGLTRSADERGYFGYHANHAIYFEVISFDKLVHDSELRNRILFKKMGAI